MFTLYLIITMYNPSSNSSASSDFITTSTLEFTSKQKCLQAANIIIAKNTDGQTIRAFCFEK
jgi:hypothetical protein